MRFRFRRIASILGTLGLVTAPAAIPGGGSQAQAQQAPTKQQAVATVAQVPQAQQAVDYRSFFGAHQRHPMWLGRAKHGKGRKGTRSRWDYRR